MRDRTRSGSDALKVQGEALNAALVAGSVDDSTV